MQYLDSFWEITKGGGESPGNLELKLSLSSSLNLDF